MSHLRSRGEAQLVHGRQGLQAQTNDLSERSRFRVKGLGSQTNMAASGTSAMPNWV